MQRIRVPPNQISNMWSVGGPALHPSATCVQQIAFPRSGCKMFLNLALLSLARIPLSSPSMEKQTGPGSHARLNFKCQLACGWLQMETFPSERQHSSCEHPGQNGRPPLQSETASGLRHCILSPCAAFGCCCDLGGSDLLNHRSSLAKPLGLARSDLLSF